MKKRIFLMLGVVAMLASCSQGEDLLPKAYSETARVTINLQTPDVQTRAAAIEVTNWVCEYQTNEAESSKVQKTSSNGSFALELTKGKEYTFLFWADRDANAYNTEDLKAVTYTTATNAGVEAWYGKLVKTISAADNEGFNVTLKRAVAKLEFNNNADFVSDENTLKVTYPKTVTFNAADGTVTETETTFLRTFPCQKGENGTDICAIVTDYILAPATEKQLGTLKVQLNAEAEKTIANVPVQANYATCISGAYSNLYTSTFNVSSEVEKFTEENTEI